MCQNGTPEAPRRKACKCERGRCAAEEKRARKEFRIPDGAEQDGAND